MNLERWLVSYADFITLLFAFFVVMYAMANQDKAKAKQIVEAIEKSFNGPASKLDLGSGREVNVLTNPSSIRGQVVDTPMGFNNSEPNKTPELAQIASRIEESLAYQLQTTDLKDHLQIIYDERGLVVRISANKLFDPGMESVKVQYLPLLDKIGEVISSSDRLVRIEGHTDTTSIPVGSKFPTNWELSTARSAWIVRYLKAKFKLPTSRFSAAGFADGHPIGSNKTEEGRARNRRVEVVITNVKDVSE